MHWKICVLLCLFSLTGSPSYSEVSPKPKLLLALTAKQLSIALNNDSKQAVSFYNGFRDYDRFVPGNIEVLLKNSRTGALLNDPTKTVWLPGAKKGGLVSQVQLESLKPGKGISLEIPVGFLLGRLRPEYLQDATHIKVGCRVYIDQKLRRYVEAESKWIPISQD